MHFFLQSSMLANHLNKCIFIKNSVDKYLITAFLNNNMALAFSDIYCHLVWRISAASAVMMAPTRKLVRSFLEDFAEQFGYECIVVSVLEDHVHMLAKLLPGIAPGLLVELLKEELTQYLQKKLAMKNPPQWDDAYGIVSISGSHLEMVAKYIAQQEKHHRKGTTNKTLERVRD